MPVDIIMQELHWLNVYEMPKNTTADERYNDRKIYHENLVSTYIESLAFLKKFIKIPFKLADDGITRIEMVPSYIAVREALANMLMHRDYFERGFAAVRVHPDRITFRNPGPSPLTLNEILTGAETAPRNPIIARAFRLAGWAELAGSGMLKIIGQWHESGYAEPVIENDNPRGWFSLTLPFEQVKAKGSEKSSEKILRMIADNPIISAEEIAESLGITSRAVEKQIASLKKKGMIRRIGPDRGGHWEVIGYV